MTIRQAAVYEHQPVSIAPCPVQLRHPNVLQFKDAAEMEVRGETVILLVTEFVTPLQEHLNSLDIQVFHPRQSDLYIREDYCLDMV
jgi:hypothetical protein